MQLTVNLHTREWPRRDRYRHAFITPRTGLNPGEIGLETARVFDQRTETPPMHRSNGGFWRFRALNLCAQNTPPTNQPLGEGSAQNTPPTNQRPPGSAQLLLATR